MAVSLKVSCHVSVAVCDRIAAPILVGVVRPTILLPAAALAGWNVQQLEMVLLHELAHVRRCDNLVNLVQRIVESTLFFQPMVWLVSGWVRQEREHCCDELVVARTHRPRAYAEMLVSLSDKFSQRPSRSTPIADDAARWQAASSMAERPLVARVRRILKKEEQSMQVSRKAVGLMLAGVLVFAAMIGGYCSLPGYAEDPPAASSGPSRDAAAESQAEEPRPTPPECQEGKTVAIVDIVGNSTLSSERLIHHVHVRPGQRFSRQQSDEDIERLAVHYRTLGFFRVRIGRGLSVIPSRKEDATASTKADSLAVTIHIDEGPQYRIRAVKVVGNKAFPNEALLRELTLKGGDYFNQAKMTADQQSLLKKYATAGYVHAQVKPALRFVKDRNALDLAYNVEEVAPAESKSVSPDTLDVAVAEGQTITVEFKVRKKPDGRN